MTSRWLAWRTIRQHPIRGVLATIGVAFIGALLFDMLMLSHGLVDSFAALLDDAGYDIRVMASDGVSLVRTPMTGATQLAADIARLTEVRAVSVLRIERAMLVEAPDREVLLLGSNAAGSHSGWMLTGGADLPAVSAVGDCPLVIGRHLAVVRRLEPGATVRIRGLARGASALPPVSCRIVGVANFLFATAEDFYVATTLAGVQAITGDASDEADFVFVSSAPGVGAAAAVRAIAPIRPDLHAYSNEDLMEQFNRNSFTYFRQISFVLTSLTLAFAFLLVSTLLTVATNQRLGEIAALRALGVSRRRISAMLLWESALLVTSGGLFALPLGGAIAVWLDRVLREMPGVPERLHFFVFEPRSVVTHLLLLAVTGVFAAAYPIWLAARLPIAPTLRREVVG